MAFFCPIRGRPVASITIPTAAIPLSIFTVSTLQVLADPNAISSRLLVIRFGEHVKTYRLRDYELGGRGPQSQMLVREHGRHQDTSDACAHRPEKYRTESSWVVTAAKIADQIANTSNSSGAEYHPGVYPAKHSLAIDLHSLEPSLPYPHRQALSVNDNQQL